MSVGDFTLATASLLPWTAVAALGAICAFVLAFGLLRRARGLPWRAVAFAILLAALVNPSIVEEQRLPQRDIAIVIVDESPSQRIGDRQRATETALAALKDRLAGERGLDLRVIRAGKPQPGAGDDGTRLFAALDRAMSEVPRQRLSGIVMITDGQVHDVPSGDAKSLKEAIGAPLHVLLSGQPNEGDRRLVVDQAPSFGLVGKELKLTIRVEDLPETPAQTQQMGAASQAKVSWRKDGGTPHPIMVPVDRNVTLPVANLHAVPDGVADDAAVFTEPLAAAFEIPAQVRIEPGMSAVVLGDGKLGLLVAQVLARAGARVLVVGKHDDHLALLRRRGIDTVSLEHWDRARADLVVEATGSAAGFALAIGATRPRGTVVAKSTVAETAPLNLAPLVIDEITVVGSRCGPFEPALQALAADDVDVRALIAARHPLRDAVEALRHAARPGVLKVLLEMPS